MEENALTNVIAWLKSTNNDNGIVDELRKLNPTPDELEAIAKKRVANTLDDEWQKSIVLKTIGYQEACNRFDKILNQSSRMLTQERNLPRDEKMLCFRSYSFRDYAKIQQLVGAKAKLFESTAEILQSYLELPVETREEKQRRRLFRLIILPHFWSSESLVNIRQMQVFKNTITYFKNHANDKGDKNLQLLFAPKSQNSFKEHMIAFANAINDEPCTIALKNDLDSENCIDYWKSLAVPNEYQFRLNILKNLMQTSEPKTNLQQLLIIQHNKLSIPTETPKTEHDLVALKQFITYATVLNEKKFDIPEILNTTFEKMTLNDCNAVLELLTNSMEYHALLHGKKPLFEPVMDRVRKANDAIEILNNSKHPLQNTLKTLIVLLFKIVDYLETQKLELSVSEMQKYCSGLFQVIDKLTSFITDEKNNPENLKLIQENFSFFEAIPLFQTNVTWSSYFHLNKVEYNYKPQDKKDYSLCNVDTLKKLFNQLQNENKDKDKEKLLNLLVSAFSNTDEKEEVIVIEENEKRKKEIIIEKIISPPSFTFTQLKHLHPYEYQGLETRTQDQKELMDANKRTRFRRFLDGVFANVLKKKLPKVGWDIQSAGELKKTQEKYDPSLEVLSINGPDSIMGTGGLAQDPNIKEITKRKLEKTNTALNKLFQKQEKNEEVTLEELNKGKYKAIQSITLQFRNVAGGLDSSNPYNRKENRHNAPLEYIQDIVTVGGNRFLMTAQQKRDLFFDKRSVRQRELKEQNRFFKMQIKSEKGEKTTNVEQCIQNKKEINKLAAEQYDALFPVDVFAMKLQK